MTNSIPQWGANHPWANTYLWQSQPITFNQGWNNIPLWGGYSSSGATTATSSSESKDLTYEEKLEQYKQKAELREAKKEYEVQLNEVNTTYQKLNSSVQEDGTAEIKTEMKDYKKLPWWKKALRAGTNMLQGCWKLATNFVGYEDGKWNWKKCLKNVGIAAAVIATTCIPVVGPVISTGLLVSGAVAGAVGTGVGVYKACKAETVEELDKSFQDIGAGAFVGITSALGVKGLSKAGGGGISGIVNSTKQGMAAGRQGIQANGFWKTWGNNLKAQLPASPKKKFDDSKNQLIDKLKSEQNPDNKLIQELNNCKTKRQWDNLSKNSNAHKRLQKLQSNPNAREDLIQRAEELTKQIEALSKLRLSTMRQMALRPKKYQADLKSFVGSSRTRLGYQWAMRGNITTKSIMKTPFKLAWKSMSLPFKPWSYVSKTPAGSFYKLEQTILPEYESNMLDGLFGQALGGTQYLSAEEVSQTIAQLNEAKSALESELGTIKENIASLA